MNEKSLKILKKVCLYMPIIYFLCIGLFGFAANINFSGYKYWLLCLCIGVALSAYCIITNIKASKEKYTKLAQWTYTFCRFRFLLKQLISRDFKKKYKRSALGFVWSFLNPLLTMSVQYLVFSTIFRSTIENFPIYLLVGTVFFGFFTESVGLGITSILENSALITKVYLPKYIFPITRVLSTSINLFISMIPMLLAVLVTRTKITKAIILLPFGIVFTVGFCIGLVLILSAAMVFFRDVSFLWGIMSMIWTYATPLFYPASIIPAKYMPIYSLNPMFHFITFIRTILIQGVAPTINEFIICFIFSAGAIIVGLFIFKKVQNKFVFYI